MDVRLLKQGNQNAFQQLIGETHREILRLAFRFTNNSDDAKDIMQDVYLDAWRHINQFREEAQIRTWLYRITVNKSLNFLRKSKNRNGNLAQTRSNEYQPLPIEPAAGAGCSPEKPLETKELRHLLESALNRLPESQRTAFLLFHHEDLTYKQIAEIMETSVGAVESLLVRAKANLRKMLGEYYKNYLQPAQVFNP